MWLTCGEALARYPHQNGLFRGPGGIFLGLVILAGVAVLAALLDPAGPPLLGVGHASDGDSLRLNSDRVRLLGIDAPELDQTCTGADGRVWTCGRSARDRLAALLASGKLDCQPEGHDQYGRVLAVCRVDGDDIGRLMVADGLAIASGRYWAEEQDARSARRGIWAGAFDTPRDWRDGKSDTGLWGWIGGLLQ